MENKYLEKIAMNRGAKEMLKQFKNLKSGATEVAAHLGHKTTGKLSDVKGAAKNVFKVSNGVHEKHIDMDPLMKNRGKTLKDRIKERSPDVAEAYDSKQRSKPQQPKWPF